MIVLVFLRLVDHKQVKPLTEAALAGTRAKFDFTAGRELNMFFAVCAIRGDDLHALQLAKPIVETFPRCMCGGRAVSCMQNVLTELDQPIHFAD